MVETTASKKPKNLFYYVNTVIVFALMFGIGQIPPFAQITPLGMQILGIFVGVLYGWCTVSLIWPSLVGIIAVGMTDFATTKEVFAMAFGNDIPLMILVVVYQPENWGRPPLGIHPVDFCRSVRNVCIC